MAKQSDEFLKRLGRKIWTGFGYLTPIAFFASGIIAQLMGVFFGPFMGEAGSYILSAIVIFGVGYKVNRQAEDGKHSTFLMVPMQWWALVLVLWVVVRSFSFGMGI